MEVLSIAINPRYDSLFGVHGHPTGHPSAAATGALHLLVRYLLRPSAQRQLVLDHGEYFSAYVATKRLFHATSLATARHYV